MAVIRVSVLAAIALAVSTANALATASCEVNGAGAKGIALRAQPRAGSKVIRMLKNGDLVSLFDDAASRRNKGWSRIAHSAKGEAAWGSGDKGWTPTKFLKDCG